MTARFTAALALAFLCVLPSRTSAHSIGQTLEQEVGEYLVDIGYDTAEIMQDQEVLFNAALIQGAGTTHWQYAPYDEVWIQIGPSNSEPLRAIIPVKSPSPVNLRYTFAQAKTHQLSVRFLQDGKTLADASFTLPVGEASGGVDANTMKGVYLILFGVLLLFVIGVITYRRSAEISAAIMRRPAMKPVKTPAAHKHRTKPKAKAKVTAKAKKPKRK
jgi:hypothetical protein